MLASFEMGLVGGQRAMTPLATVAIAAARGELPAGNGAPKIWLIRSSRRARSRWRSANWRATS